MELELNRLRSHNHNLEKTNGETKHALTRLRGADVEAKKGIEAAKAEIQATERGIDQTLNVQSFQIQGMLNNINDMLVHGQAQEVTKRIRNMVSQGQINPDIAFSRLSSVQRILNDLIGGAIQSPNALHHLEEVLKGKLY